MLQVIANKLPVGSKPRRMILEENEQKNLDLNSEGVIYIDCNVYQAAVLNTRLPKGFKIEQDESVFKAISLRLQN